VTGLLESAATADGFAGLSDHARLGLEPGAPHRALSLLAHLEGDSILRAYGSLERLGGIWTLETVVEPLHREDPADFHAALLDTAVAQVASGGGGTLHVWLRDGCERQEASVRSHGMQAIRELLQLRVPLPVDPGRVETSRPIPVRPFRPGRDDAAWLEVNRRAFVGHPEQGSWTAEDLERREHEPWFDASGFLLHEVGGRLAGFCWTKVHRAPLLGEIYVIGVDPDFQGRGLGRGLTLAGLDHLATRGVPVGMLYVEATNVAALALYRTLGFAEHHRETVYAAEIDREDRAVAPTA
jgi:mycothiol synthase